MKIRPMTGKEQEMFVQIATLRAQRDALLAACERMERYFEQHSTPELQGIACDVFAAISKAKRA